MAPFGFTPDDGDDEERKNRENLEAMMRQMQEQIQQLLMERSHGSLMVTPLLVDIHMRKEHHSHPQLRML